MTIAVPARGSPRGAGTRRRPCRACRGRRRRCRRSRRAARARPRRRRPRAARRRRGWRGSAASCGAGTRGPRRPSRCSRRASSHPLPQQRRAPGPFGDRLLAGGDAELRVQRARVGLDRVARDEQLVGDLAQAPGPASALSTSISRALSSSTPSTRAQARRPAGRQRARVPRAPAMRVPRGGRRRPPRRPRPPSAACARESSSSVAGTISDESRQSRASSSPARQRVDGGVGIAAQRQHARARARHRQRVRRAAQRPGVARGDGRGRVGGRAGAMSPRSAATSASTATGQVGDERQPGATAACTWLASARGASRSAASRSPSR